MQKENKSVWTWLGVFLSGGGIYSVLEILWRGYTHWTMAVTGGVCLVLLHGLNRLCARWALVFRCLTGSAIITAMELAVGLIVNRAAGLATSSGRSVRRSRQCGFSSASRRSASVAESIVLPREREGSRKFFISTGNGW